MYQAPTGLKRPSVVPGILLMVAGVLGLLLAVGIIMIPGALFLLAGGGNVDAFDDFARGFVVTASIVGIVSLAMLITGIVLTVKVGRKRRRINVAAMGRPFPR
ncbi:hypothetical protein [Brevibacterium sp. ZH18]|uniref:hypothetical protein n=1 Tax=Brevibacterium sp. ZH18 TaxID=2927784 RepID=UPI001F6188F4|nr:hypothetical protein [Brevibacterium sp. ZH18]MCI4011566.1 hypothetical protein [Brevibacterium sp. ZH18]